jgi:hypothetical protein
MSLAFLTKPIGGSKNKDGDSQERPGGQPGPVRGGASSNLAVGGAPRVDLMPPEISLKRAQLRTRRKLRLGLFGVFVIVAVGCGASWTVSTVAQTTLASAQSQQQQLVAQQSKYSAVTNVKDSITLIKAGQRVGDSTEIDWQDYLTKLQGTLPSGVTLQSVTVEMATPVKQYTESTVPLQGDRIATLSFSATSASLPTIPVWLDGLATLPGFADATPGDVTLSQGTYTANVTMHINSHAFNGRYETKQASSTTDGAASDGGN